MPIPDYQSLMRPVLQALAQGGPMRSEDLREQLSRELSLTPEELNERLASGTATFTNRVAWALVHLTKAGLLVRPSRGVYNITPRGERFLVEHTGRVDRATLRQFPEFVEFVTPSETTESETPANLQQTPTELIEATHAEITSALREELLDQILLREPAFFEQVVIDLLIAMGYGGSRVEAAQHLGRGGDEGVDGVIQEDRLGLDLLYIQAKRWAKDRAVGRPDVQAFVGALQGQRATKGALITTSRFTPEAARYADSVSPRVVLIDGAQLAELMIEHEVGVTVRRRFALYGVDQDYFTEQADALS